MVCLCEIDYEQLSTWIAIILAIFSIFFSLRINRISQIYSLISIKTSECNSYIDLENPESMPQNIGQFSGIISSIITCKELINELKTNWLFLSRTSRFKRIFYLQLHTTIRVMLTFNEKDSSIKEFMIDETLHRQFLDSKKFLKKEINRNNENTPHNNGYKT